MPAELQDWMREAAKEIVAEAFNSSSSDPQHFVSMCEQRIAAHAPGWISVEERLPAGEQRCLVYRPEVAPSYLSAMYCVKHSKGRGFYCGDAVNGVTHWQPLPTPPRRKP